MDYQKRQQLYGAQRRQAQRQAQASSLQPPRPPTPPQAPRPPKPPQRKYLARATLTLLALLVAGGIIWLQAPWENAIGGASLFGHKIVKPAYALTPTDVSKLTETIDVADIWDTHYLVLVNRDHSITSQPSSALAQGLIASELYSVSNTVETLYDEDILLHGRALSALEELMHAAHNAGFDTLRVSSGYRTFDMQEQLYLETPDKSLVQKPNHSEHQTGLAVDIAVLNLTQDDMNFSPAAKWLVENSWKYGLVLRYAPDKQALTHISGEPWHFRFIGRPHAWYCWQNNLCLEEYLDFLEESGGYSTTLDGMNYTVVYEKAENGRLAVPPDSNFIISSDNMGGYIVTTWE